MKAHIDFETKSLIDLTTCGADKYARDLSTEVLCLGWVLGDNPEAVDCFAPGMPEPTPLLDHIENGGTVAIHNAAFELLIWEHVISRMFPHWPKLRITQVSCTMARAYACAFPGSLDKLAPALGLSEAKDKAGRAAMMKMCKPDARIYRAEGRIVWHDTPELRATLYSYCKQDVRTEIAIDKKLPELTPSERIIWELDWKINRHGIRIDAAFCEAGNGAAAREKKRANAALVALTKGAVKSASAPKAMKDWLAAQGLELDNLKKRTVERAINEKEEGTADDIIEALELRQEASKSSLKKFATALKCLNDDGRIRGQIQYHGATTGRFAGRLWQPHNLKRSELLQEIIDAVINCTLSIPEPEIFINHFWGDAIGTLSNCMRATAIPAEGCELFYGDYANIEGRTLAWLAGEEWKLDAYRDYDAGIGPDTYKLAYASSFRIPVASVTDDQRQIGKVQELALGYQGGVGAFKSMGENYGVYVLGKNDKAPKKAKQVLTEEQADEIKTAWRAAHPTVKQFWYDLEAAAIRAVQNPGVTFAAIPQDRFSDDEKTREVKDARRRACELRPIRYHFSSKSRMLRCQLPSGRVLQYPYADLSFKKVPWSDEPKLSLRYWGIQAPPKGKGIWEQLWSYGGHLCENITQAVARDILAAALYRLDRAGYAIPLHVHDEIVCEVPYGTKTVDDMRRLMSVLPPWAKGLPVAVKVQSGKRYYK